MGKVVPRRNVRTMAWIKHRVPMEPQNRRSTIPQSSPEKKVVWLAFPGKWVVKMALVYPHQHWSIQSFGDHSPNQPRFEEHPEVTHVVNCACKDVKYSVKATWPWESIEVGMLCVESVESHWRSIFWGVTSSGMDGPLLQIVKACGFWRGDFVEFGLDCPRTRSWF